VNIFGMKVIDVNSEEQEDNKENNQKEKESD
jgi:hypothetical protein